MFTAEEVKSVKFTKAVFGGYDMAMVDDFLDRVADNYAELSKENGTLKSKMRILVEKIEEYKKVDEEMRQALVAAKGAADNIISDAKNRAENMLNEAKNEAHAKITELNAQIFACEKKLNTIKGLTAQFVDSRTEDYAKQVDLLQKIIEDEGLCAFEPPMVQSFEAPTTSANLSDTKVIGELPKEIIEDSKMDTRDISNFANEFDKLKVNEKKSNSKSNSDDSFIKAIEGNLLDDEEQETPKNNRKIEVVEMEFSKSDDRKSDFDIEV